MKTSRIQIKNLAPASVTDLSNEHLMQAAGGGGSLSFGTTSYTGEWKCMDVDSPIYDAMAAPGGGHSLA